MQERRERSKGIAIEEKEEKFLPLLRPVDAFVYAIVALSDGRTVRRATSSNSSNSSNSSKSSSSSSRSYDSSWRRREEDGKGKGGEMAIEDKQQEQQQQQQQQLQRRLFLSHASDPFSHPSRLGYSIERWFSFDRDHTGGDDDDDDYDDDYDDYDANDGDNHDNYSSKDRNKGDDMATPPMPPPPPVLKIVADLYVSDLAFSLSDKQLGEAFIYKH